MKKFVVLLVFLVAGFSSMLAQTSTKFDNQSTTGSYTNTPAVTVSISKSPVTTVNGTHVAKGGTIYLQAGPLPFLALASGGAFSGGSFTYSSIPNFPTGSGTGTANNLAGTFTVTSKSTSGSGSTCKYRVSMTFSGWDSTNVAFAGTSTQLFTVKISQSGAVTSVQGNGGSTTIMQ